MIDVRLGGADHFVQPLGQGPTTNRKTIAAAIDHKSAFDRGRVAAFNFNDSVDVVPIGKGYAEN